MNDPNPTVPANSTFDNRPRPLSWTRLIALLGVMVLGLIAVMAMSGWLFLLPTSSTSHAAVGRPLPELDVVPLTGDPPPATLEELRGQVVLINFWATWCPPCRRELPDIAALWERYADSGDVRVLAVSCNRVPEDVGSLREATANLLDEMNLALPTYADPFGRTRLAFDQVGSFRGYPTTVLLGPDGVIRAVWVGAASGSQLEAGIGRVLQPDAD